MSNKLLELRNVTKSFDGNDVLKGVSFHLEKGQILGLVGENGAGKSTMMNMLFGMTFIKTTGGYDGEIIFDGKVIDFKNPTDALNAGIGMVHQEFSLIPGFTVTENILLNNEITKKNLISSFTNKKLETLDYTEMTANTKAALDKLGVDISPDTRVEEMPVGHKQFIEIARELNKENVKLVIMDEPTAVLTESEADILIKAMKSLSAKGISIIFISHRLREIIDVCDKVVVLRDGVVIEERPIVGVTTSHLAKWMVGRDVSSEKHVSVRHNISSSDIILDVQNLWVDMPGEAVKSVDLKVRRGEILGIGGLAGQGKLGIPNGIMGLFPAGGTVLYNGKALNLKNPMSILKQNLAFVSEDRRGVGLLLDESIDWNIAFNAMQVQDKFLKNILGFKFRDSQEMKKVALKYIEELQIKCTGFEQKARNLSGGNQQKVCLAKAFCMEPELLFVSEPTRGIDVGAKALVLEALVKHNQENGTTIVMVSSELEELRSICDRIAIICDGKVEGILGAGDDIEKFGLLMSGEKLEGVS